VPFHPGQTQQTGCTISISTHCIWCQETICHRNFKSTTSERKREKIHPESMWQVSLSWPRSGFNNTVPNQRNSITIIEAYYRHNEADDPIVRLFGITRGGNYYVQRERNDIGSTQ
jgi:hypothetical protein